MFWHQKEWNKLELVFFSKGKKNNQLIKPNKQNNNKTQTIQKKPNPRKSYRKTNLTSLEHLFPQNHLMILDTKKL